MLDFIAQKLLPPTTAGTLLSRPDVMARLDAASEHRIVLLRAPAGYGKTSILRLLHARLAALGAQVAWLTFDKADSDPARLLMALRAALLGVGAQPDAAASRLGASGVRHLFLDDVEHLDERAIRLLMSTIVEVLPAQMHVYVGSRSLHQVSVANLKAKQVLLELNLENLRFVNAETEAYLRTANLFLSEQELHWLQQTTEGWPAAVELLVLAWKRIQCRVNNRLPDLHGMTDLSDYLAEEVLRSQPAAVQAFLVATAPLQSFSVALADAVRGAADSDQMIARIRRAGLPIQPIGEQWYRYHPLFAGHIVRKHLAAHAGHASTYALAAAWLARHDRGLEAFDCYIKAGDHGGAADILDALADTLRVRAQFPSLLDCCHQLPEDVLRQRPRLALSLLIALSYSSHHAETQRWLDYFRARAAEPGSDAVYADGLRAFEPLVAYLVGDVARSLALAERYWPEHQQAQPYERGVLATLVTASHLACGRLPQAVHMLIEARRISGQSGSVSNMAVVIFLQAFLDAIEGRLDMALQQMATIEQLHLRHSTTIPPAFLYSYSAGLLLMVLYERNELDEAAACMKLVRGMAGITQPWDALCAVKVTQARLMALQASPASARRWLECEVMKAHKHAPAQLRAALEAELSRMAVVSGNATSIAAYAALVGCSAGAPAACIFPSEEIDGAGIAQARLAIASGKIDAALAHLHSLLHQAEHAGRRWRAAKLRVLLALALARAGQACDALATLAQALEQGAQSGLVRTFVDEGEAALRLLRALQEQGARLLSAAAGAHLAKVLQCAAPPADRQRAQLDLSASELALLKLVARGLSNRDAAATLGLSINTVKWHLAQIFDRFGVSNRLQAVNAARQAGLLDDIAPAAAHGTRR